MSEWTAQLESYRRQEVTKEALYPFWLTAIDELCPRLNVRDYEEQAKPLFTNGWSPADAVDHLARVWVMKGWVR